MAKNTSILLGDYFDNFINQQVQSGKFSSASEVVRAALRMFEHEETRKTALIKELKKGEKGGMISEVFDNIPNRFVSIRHYGLLKANAEITKEPEVEKWANGFENYTFEENNGTTTVTVDLDIAEEFSDYMNQTYPKALSKLKEICEQ